MTELKVELGLDVVKTIVEQKIHSSLCEALSGQEDLIKQGMGDWRRV